MLVKCTYSLISPGTELSLYTGAFGGLDDPTNLWAKYPFYPGYAAVGTVELVGSAVRGLLPGDLVYYPGCHQRYAVVSPSSTPVLPVRSDLPLELVPFARLGQIASTAAVFSEAAHGDVVAVIGLGLIGNLAAQLFRLRGATVIGIDLVEFRRGLATQAGIPRVVDAEHQDAVNVVIEATDGAGARTVVEATGYPALVKPALRMARTRGEVILLGSPLTRSHGSAQIDVETLHLIHRKGVCLKGAHASLLPQMPTGADGPNQQTITEQMLRLLQERRLVVEHLISEVIQPSEIERAYGSLLSQKDRTMAVLIDWTRD